MAFYTPLRYPGGKGKLAYYLKGVIKHNSLLDCHYIEPFAGGAGVALELLMQEYVQKVTINDYDPAIYSFWHSILNNCEEFCEKIHQTEVSMNTWYEQKEILSTNSYDDLLSLGFAAFFMNRTNRSGILNAGVIGGKAQAGKWKLDVRFNKEDLVNRIKRIAAYKDRITIQNKDTLDLLIDLSIKSHENTLMYLDPPYYVKGQELYRNFYEHQDHVDIKNQLLKMPILHWIATYDNTEQIKDIYKGQTIIDFDLQYSAQSKRVGSEVIIFSKNLKIPSVELGKKKIKETVS
ncbi:DNA adenine methylase [Salmonella enterica]|uniref:site-specific DNA-methyltransferase (adenine-specific) n=1 Tax=Salmonella enterica TaxID=28901 RepID=A0A764FUL8_SALER|nr:DNA adenine methylase [Salmonella enterica]EBZ4429147.1 DNA adenine methylase [Salmonella enterica subsp. enterica serovar Derby]ECL7328278.1 DNA adenine methylase [Salmonella enterica subsp. enterica serovar Waycross]EDU3767006.1 DNA adenine methylase [Salmonella enterica subsp. enterica serovar Minnesota]EDY4086127.1 DNA adenine methylase [Salmonella enterica subsp. enterica]EGB5301376.1 DNA adenine methylase [Salmonella enterica subsp. enterica serovar 16:b:-]NCI15392.1 DNA adenine meth